MAAAERLIADAFTCTATGFLCHDGPDGTVVASPVAFTPTGDADSFARWVTLDELSASPLYAPVSFAMNHCSAWMHGSTTFLPDAIRGARSARPFMTPAYQPALSLDSWSKQLALAEQTDVLLRRVLDARGYRSRLPGRTGLGQGHWFPGAWDSSNPGSRHRGCGGGEAW